MPVRRHSAKTRQAIGRRIKTYREISDLTQAALGGQVYVTQSAVAQWESGATLPSRPLQHRLCEVLKSERWIVFKEIVEAENRAAA